MNKPIIGTMAIWEDNASLIVAVATNSVLILHPHGWEYYKESDESEYLEVAPWLQDRTKVWELRKDRITTTKHLRKE